MLNIAIVVSYAYTYMFCWVPHHTVSRHRQWPANIQYTHSIFVLHIYCFTFTRHALESWLHNNHINVFFFLRIHFYQINNTIFDKSHTRTKQKIQKKKWNLHLLYYYEHIRIKKIHGCRTISGGHCHWLRAKSCVLWHCSCCHSCCILSLYY